MEAVIVVLPLATAIYLQHSAAAFDLNFTHCLASLPDVLATSTDRICRSMGFLLVSRASTSLPSQNKSFDTSASFPICSNHFNSDQVCCIQF